MLFTLKCLGTGSTTVNYVIGHVNIFKVEKMNESEFDTQQRQTT